MKVQIINFVPAQIPYLGEFKNQNSEPKCSANEIAGFLNQLYRKRKLMSLYDDTDSRNTKDNVYF